MTLNFRIPSELLLGASAYTIPAKVFGCTYYVRNHTPTTSKILEPSNAYLLDILLLKKDINTITHLPKNSMRVWMLPLGKMRAIFSMPYHLFRGRVQEIGNKKRCQQDLHIILCNGLEL